MRDGDTNAALLVLFSTALALRQDSGVRRAGVAGDEKVKGKSELVERVSQINLSYREQLPFFFICAISLV